MKSRIAVLLLSLAFLAGQWAYAEHEAEAIGNSHSHSVNCPVCLVDTQAAAVSSSLGSQLEYFQAAPPANTVRSVFCAVFPRNHSIRAPPVH